MFTHYNVFVVKLVMLSTNTHGIKKIIKTVSLVDVMVPFSWNEHLFEL